ncbi:23S rRNA m(2)A-2503 methyltransferase [Desulfocicer vacuolatum DSM 3385]|uniref:Probable dual-specificity RNA methyltransferase RlmN n=1 Tax=Desulfocicer vacuolatum DSM 3385 TaxID=1121400 RepID=A0A1W2CQW7_9BACT|nr:23S rRNA (adenine(2503)-C(2))-methyltransferase RlmN [Desulfocicer vacuolatum]SMC87593.1 23S rRNA m(2)A-2503 methyltransferase [Desulfocicer vacuolatum DSM 3385]
MEDIKNYSRKALEKWFENQGMRSFRAGQIFKWIYLRQADSFEEMTDLGKVLRQTLASHFSIPRLELERSEVSKDGTEKLLFRLTDGNYIESVLIPQKDHYTLCISSQAGCRQACKFCLTAKGGFHRNLTCAEIVSQVRDARQHLALKNGTAPLSNIVFMGMGEPLDNYEAVIKALSIITDSDYGLKFSPRRVTVSTCGLVPEILRLGLDTEANLAISLNATQDSTRTALMPVNRRYPMAKLLDACGRYHMKPRNKITFEYILIKGINDSDADAHRLVRLLAPIKAKVNLIPFNPHEKSEFQRPSPGDVSRFMQILLDRQVTAIVRKSKGDDISAACGQLKAKMGECCQR